MLRDVTDMKALCSIEDLIPNAGVCALHDDKQIAIFYLPNTEEKVFAIDNYDPFGKANVLSKGIIGNVGEQTVVASPLYKQHFDLRSGTCIENDSVILAHYPVILSDDKVFIAV